MAGTKIDLNNAEQVQGTLPVGSGGTGATTLADAGVEQTANKNAISGYAGLNSSGYVGVGQLGSGGASSSTFLRGDNSWAAPPGGASGMLLPVQGHTNGTETYTIASGTVTQISGTSIASGAYSPAVGDRILILTAPAASGTTTNYNRSYQPGNGIYVVTSNTTNLSLSRSVDMSGSVNPCGLSVYSENTSITWNGLAVFTVYQPTGLSTFTWGTTSLQWQPTGGVNISPSTVLVGNGSAGQFGMYNTTPGINSYIDVNSGSPSGTNQHLTLPAPTTDTLVSRTSTDILTNKTLTGPVINTTPPSSPTATGTAGQIAEDANYWYVCTGTNYWTRIPLTQYGTVPQVVQTATGSAWPLSFPNAVQPGNTVIVFGEFANPSVSGVQISGPTLGGTSVSGASPIWNVNGENGIGTTTGSADIFVTGWILPNCPPANGINFTTVVPTFLGAAHAYEVAGLGTVPTVNAQSSGHANGTAISSGASPVTTFVPAIVFGAATAYGTTNTAPTGGFTYMGAGYGWSGYQIATALGGSYTWAQTASASANWCAGVAAIVNGGGWPTTPQLLASGMLAPVQAHTNGSETYTIAGGSVTQISGTTIQGGTYTPAIGDRILISTAPASSGAGTTFQRTTNANNGIYVVTSTTTNLSLSRSTDMSGSVNPTGLTVFSESTAISWEPQAIWTVTTPSTVGTFTWGTTSLQFTVTAGLNQQPQSLYMSPTSPTNLPFAFGWWNGIPAISTYLVPNSSAVGSGGNQTLILPATATATLLGSGLTSTVTSTTAITMTAASNPIQLFTGSSIQTLLLPTTGIPVGYPITVINQATNNVTIQSSGANTIVVAPPNTITFLWSNVATPTTAANWTAIQPAVLNLASGYVPTAQLGTNLASALLFLRGDQSWSPALVPGLTSTTMAGTTTTMTMSSNPVQVFTGSLGATLVLPTTSVPAGYPVTVINQGTNNVTIQSSGLNTIVIAAPGTLTFLWANIATPTTAGNWTAVEPAMLNLGSGYVPTAQLGTNLANSSLFLRGDQAWSNVFVNQTITGYNETQQAMGTVGATATIPALSGGTVITATLTASTQTTFTMPALPVAGNSQSFSMPLKQAATTGGGTAVFTGVKWPANTAPTQTATAATMDLYSFLSDGVDWYGSVIQGYVP